MTNKDSTAKCSQRKYRYRLRLLFLLTAIVGVPAAYLTNVKAAFNEDSSNLQRLRKEIQGKFETSFDTNDSFGITSMHTSTFDWEETQLGKLTGIPFLKRITSITLHSNECEAKIPDEISSFNKLETLVLRGEFDENDIGQFGLEHPNIEIIQIAN